ncbi:MAG TPA: hypothetical protein VFT81_01010 [Dermatophilaceae bacterium]|nr:hypothetical protein [Dermatophilaceae bacterium]
MKVVLLSSASAETPASFARLTEQLDLRDTYAARLVLVSWHRPSAPLPVDRALLVGPPAALSARAGALPVDGSQGPEASAPVSIMGSAEPASDDALPTKHVGRLRRVATRIAPDVLGSRFALSCLRKPDVRREVADADVVVALDAHTYRAAWLLARLHPAPAFVAGTGAGRRVIEERAALRA